MKRNRILEKTDTKSKLSENKEDGKENIKKKKGLNKEIHV